MWCFDLSSVQNEDDRSLCVHRSDGEVVSKVMITAIPAFAQCDWNEMTAMTTTLICMDALYSMAIVVWLSNGIDIVRNPLDMMGIPSTNSNRMRPHRIRASDMDSMPATT